MRLLFSHKISVCLGTRPKGIVLIAPFTSIKDLLLDYSLFGLVPILQPLGMFPPLQSQLYQLYHPIKLSSLTYIGA